jgi:EmrB/QacA subfamily drug resistance transporter
MATTTATAPLPARPPTPLLGLGAVLALGAIMMQLDMTMTNVAVNSLLREFAVPLSTIQWVTTGYLLAMATVIPVAGWAMGRYGARAVWTTSLAVFLAGSTLCGLAWSAPSLIGFRVLQGLGAGLIMPLAQAILAQAAGPDRMARAMAAISVPALLGPVLGPVLGGVLVTEASWRWIFFVNVPVCLVALALSRRYVPAERAAGTGRLDVAGLVLLSGGCASAVYGLARSASAGSFRDAAAVTATLAALVLLAGYLVRSLAARAVPPVDPRLLRQRSFGSAAGVMFASTMVLFGAMALLPLYYQQVRGQSPLHTGLLMIPFGLGMGASLAVAGRLADRIAPRAQALAGLLLTATGAAILTGLSAGTGAGPLSLAQLASGAGVGLTLVPVMTTSMRGLRRDQIPGGSTAIRVIQQIGGSFGGAILFVVLQHRIAAHAVAAGGHLDAGALAGAFADTFRWVLGLALLAAVPALALPGRSRRAEPAVVRPQR